MDGLTTDRAPALITPEELAYEYLHCSRSKAYHLVSIGAVPGVMRVGSSVRISREAVETWIRSETGTMPLSGGRRTGRV